MPLRLEASYTYLLIDPSYKLPPTDHPSLIISSFSLITLDTSTFIYHLFLCFSGPGHGLDIGGFLLELHWRHCILFPVGLGEGGIFLAFTPGPGGRSPYTAKYIMGEFMFDCRTNAWDRMRHGDCPGFLFFLCFVCDSCIFFFFFWTRVRPRIYTVVNIQGNDAWWLCTSTR